MYDNYEIINKKFTSYSKISLYGVYNEINLQKKFKGYGLISVEIDFKLPDDRHCKNGNFIRNISVGNDNFKLYDKMINFTDNDNYVCYNKLHLDLNLKLGETVNIIPIANQWTEFYLQIVFEEFDDKAIEIDYNFKLAKYNLEQIRKIAQTVHEIPIYSYSRYTFIHNEYELWLKNNLHCDFTCCIQVNDEKDFKIIGNYYKKFIEKDNHYTISVKTPVKLIIQCGTYGINSYKRVKFHENIIDEEPVKEPVKEPIKEPKNVCNKWFNRVFNRNKKLKLN